MDKALRECTSYWPRLAAIVLAAAVGPAVQAQQAGKQLIGTWTLVSAVNTRPDGSKADMFGPNAKGILFFDASGRYALQVCRTDRPKFASGNRETGTPEENQAVLRGCNSHWGTYKVGESDRSIAFNIEHSLFPNWEGIQQTRTFQVNGSEMKYMVPEASAGGTAELSWKLAK